MTDEELADINQRESERMSWCMADVIDLHGDPGFTGRHKDPWSDGTPMIFPTDDPTAEGFIMPEGAEPVPAPDQFGTAVPHEAAPDGKPFILPPDQREEGKPFILPPEKRKEGKPFVLPPDQQKEGPPFLETPHESRRRPQGARIELQEQQARGWRAPNIANPWPTQTAARDPRQLTPQAPYGAAAGTPENASTGGHDQGVVPAQYQQPYNNADPDYYPPTYPNPAQNTGAAR